MYSIIKIINIYNTNKLLKLRKIKYPDIRCWRISLLFLVQGGSNMTGTDCV
jgi:hypothetical protein